MQTNYNMRDSDMENKNQLATVKAKHYTEYNDEFYETVMDLQGEAAIFQRLVMVGMRPSFDESVPTACVGFDPIKGEYIQFCFNPKFWDILTAEGRKFVVCHEMLHLLLCHGKRFMRCFDRKNGESMEIANIAMDLAVNNIVTETLGIDRDNLGIPWKDFCFYDNVIEANPKLKGKCGRYDSSETFYKVLFENADKVPCGAGSAKGIQGKGPKQKGSGEPQKGNGKDDGDNEPKDGEQKSTDHGYLKEVSEEKMNELVGKLDEFDKNELKEMYDKHAGESDSVASKILNNTKRVYKKKWESIIKKWTLRAIESLQTKLEDSFVTKPRRMPRNTGFLLPGIVETPILKHRVAVYFYLDTSGSCAHLAERFFNAALSLDPKKFEVKPFCFSDDVHAVKLSDKKLYGFGGTNFHAISQHFYSAKEVESRQGKSTLVFVITDGYGTNLDVKENERKNWFWFLSEDYKSCIPKGCWIYELKDFE